MKIQKKNLGGGGSGDGVGLGGGGGGGGGGQGRCEPRSEVFVKIKKKKSGGGGLVGARGGGGVGGGGGQEPGQGRWGGFCGVRVDVNREVKFFSLIKGWPAGFNFFSIVGTR